MAEDTFGIVGSVQAGVFRVDEVVAEGGFAIVYRAHHQGFRADVALKCLRLPDNLSEERRASFLEKFREEGELLFRLSAFIPPVVRPLHFGVLEGTRRSFVPFIALEWLEGESLDTLIRRRSGAGKRPLDLERAVKLLAPAARALERAHALPGPSGVVSVLHRDVKPENVFIAVVQGQKVTKILDFGIGKVKSEASQIAGRASTTEDALAAFTPAYGAPEQWLPKRFGQTGSWTDVWGLALTLTEVLTGQSAFEGDAQEVLGACIDETRRPTPRSFGISVPPAVERLLERALAVDPTERLHDVGAFWDEIEDVVGARSPRFDVGAPLESLLPPGKASSSGIPDLVPRTGGAALPSLPSPSAHVAPPLISIAPDALARPERAASARNGASAAKPAARAGIDLDSSDLSRGPPSRGRARAKVLSSLTPERATRAVVTRLRAPARLIALGVTLMAADLTYAQIAGASFTLGPLRAFWIAAPLVAAGIALLVAALVRD